MEEVEAEAEVEVEAEVEAEVLGSRWPQRRAVLFREKALRNFGYNISFIV